MTEKNIAEVEQYPRCADDGRGANAVGEPSHRGREGSAVKETKGICAEKRCGRPDWFGEEGFEKDPERIESATHDEHDDVCGHNEKMAVE